jgi:menaquinone-dependent protoporphyrinogen oxidase
MRTLLTYATSHASTAEISSTIHKTLTKLDPNIDIDLYPIEDVTSNDLQKYTAIIIGSAVHGMEWLPIATKFLETNAPTLRRIPVWAFSVGAPSAMPGPIQKMGLTEIKEAEILRQKVEASLTIPPTKDDVNAAYLKKEGRKSVEQPRVLKDHVFFEGKFEKKDAGVVLRAIWFCTGGKFGDFRDEGAIEGWATKVAGEIEQTEHNEVIPVGGAVQAPIQA